METTQRTIKVFFDRDNNKTTQTNEEIETLYFLVDKSL